MEVYKPTILQVPKWKKLLARMGIVVKLGYGRREGWSGELPFYLFKCPGPDCKKLVVDYPHGYGEFLSCPKCKNKIRKPR